MRRLIAGLAALVVLAFAPAAPADGPAPYVQLGGLGVLAPNGKTRYVAVPGGDYTAIARVVVHGGSVATWTLLEGSWGIPAPTARAEGLTRDGRRLIVASASFFGPSRFVVLDARTLQVRDRFELKGSFAYDALSPDASTLYLIQHVDTANTNRYVVRAYDLRAHTLRPGRIADRTQRGWVMDGFALTRATSADGRWVYTLYSRPGGYPFVHALDTVRGVAHCIGLPWAGNQSQLTRMQLALRDGGRTLALTWRSGKPWLSVDTETWRIDHPTSRGLRWRWPIAAVGVLALLAVAAALGRHARREALPQPL